MKAIEPKVSFVVVARNDNYNGDFLYRLQIFVNALLSLAEKHCLNMELVMVEWNPPRANPRLANAVKWPKSHPHCRVRIIEVPEEVHRQLPNADRKPLFEFAGKNVGVRRADGEFILVTNPDILFSEELMQYLAVAKLSPECLYRLTRYDVASPIPGNVPVEQQLAYCREHVTRVNGYLTSCDRSLGKWYNARMLQMGIMAYLVWRLRYFPFAPPFTNGSGDFFLMHKSHWHGLRAYPEVEGLCHIDSLMAYLAVFHRLKEVRLGGQLRIYHQEHGRPEGGKPFSPEVLAVRRQLFAARKPVIVNDEKWGLGAYDLPETIIA